MTTVAPDRAALEAVVEELRRLQRSGITRVHVAPETLDALTAAVRGAAAAEPEPTPDAPAVPPPPSPSVPRASAAPRSAPAVEPPPPAPALPPKSTLPPPAPITVPPGSKAERLAWLRAHVLAHPTCLANVRPGKKVVFGVGDVDAAIFFVGEAPGADEEVEGEPFVGKAGELLTKMIVAMGLARAQVYIGNVLPWRPQMPTAPGQDQVGNRPPTAEEMRLGLPFLRAQIEVVQPKLLVALGKTAAEGLLGPGSVPKLGDVRGRWHTFGDVPLMVTYHPSYLLRNQALEPKRTVWEDLLQVMERAGLPISERQRGYFRRT